MRLASFASLLALLAFLAVSAHAGTPPAPGGSPTPAAPSGHADAEKAAETAAQSWLALVDAGKYSESWDAAAAFFRGAVTRDAWVAAVKGVRGPLGAVVSRQLTSETYATSLPGAPDGEYVVLQYATSFANKKAAVETVTPMKDPDGTWRVSGYFVK